jgi:hypothetical protein
MGRPELGDEACALSLDFERVRLPDRDGDGLARPDQLRTTKALPDLDRALLHEEALLLAEVAMQGTSIPGSPGFGLRAQELRARVEHHRPQV